MEASLEIVSLRCEHRVNPLGIDERLPRLSWKLQSRQRGVSQSAYHLLVASTPETLAADTGDVWDSGKVVSSQSHLVSYAGGPLRSHQACWWKVRVWDHEGHETGWSPAARWTMGLLDGKDWKGDWIGLDAGGSPSLYEESLESAAWVWHAVDTNGTTPDECWLRTQVDVPNNRELARATVFASTDRLGMVFVNGHRVCRFTDSKTLIEMLIRGLLHKGSNTFAISVTKTDDPSKKLGVLAAIRLEFTDGTTQLHVTDERWRCSDVARPGWNMPEFDDRSWNQVALLTPGDNHLSDKPQVLDRRILPARWLRKEFTAKGSVRRATAYISGLGLSELYVNGVRVGENVLSPALAEYDRRAFYVTHDVTANIRTGVNLIGVCLGNGRLHAPRDAAICGTKTYGHPKLRFQLRLDMEDGSVHDIVSDESWQMTTEGPIRSNNEYDGELYDARMELTGWLDAGYDDSDWRPAQVVNAPCPLLCAEPIEPIKVTEILPPVAVNEPVPGMHVFDFGQNIVGWCRLKVAGPAGTWVAMHHAETIQDDGTLYVDNLRAALATDEYILKGDGVESYEPRFTYHGFRYVELTGFPGKPDLNTIEACVVHDAVEPTGHFDCSNATINQVLTNTVWGLRGNYRSIPTDCPQRDERHGWLGDRAEEARGETFVFDLASLYSKWLQDIEDTQREDGSICDIAPSYWPFYSDSLTWPSALPLISDMLYAQYGDRRPIERHYDAMKRWIDHMHQYLENDILKRYNYGDWCVPPEDPQMILSKDPARNPPREFVGTAYYYFVLMRLAEFAALLGKPDDAEEYHALAARAKHAIHTTYFDAENQQYANGTATTSVLPLAFGIVPDDTRAALVQRLVHTVTVENDNHISTGLIGGQWLMRALSDNGHADVACALAAQKSYPSWGYMLGKGATTIWELWNGDTAEPSMNSHNHVMLVGDLITWLFSGLAGIRLGAPGYSRIILRPQLVDGLDYVNASWVSPFGLIASHWKRTDGALTWRVAVPPNTTATVHVPARDVQSVRESGQLASNVHALRSEGYESGASVFTIGSGNYVFESELVVSS